MKRRKEPGPFAQACFDLVGSWQQDRHLGRGDSGTRERWKRLWASLSDSDISHLDIDDIVRCIGIGWSLAMNAGNYDEADSLLQLFWNHPRRKDADDIEAYPLRADMAVTALYLRDEDRAKEIYAEVLSDETAKWVPYVRYTIRDHMTNYCGQQEQSVLAPEWISELVLCVVRGIRRRKLPEWSGREAVTFGALTQLLKSTYPNEQLEQAG